MQSPICLAKKTGLVLQAMERHGWFRQGNYLIVFVFRIDHSGEYVKNRSEENTRSRKLLADSAI